MLSMGSLLQVVVTLELKRDTLEDPFGFSFDSDESGQHVISDVKSEGLADSAGVDPCLG